MAPKPKPKPGDYAFHRHQYLKWGKKHDRNRVRDGICLRCTEIPEINPRTGKRFTRCNKHRESIEAGRSQSRKERRAELKASGWCIDDCGRPATKWARCSKCRSRNARNKKESREKKTDAAVHSRQPTPPGQLQGEENAIVHSTQASNTNPQDHQHQGVEGQVQHRAEAVHPLPHRGDSGSAEGREA